MGEGKSSRRLAIVDVRSLQLICSELPSALKQFLNYSANDKLTSSISYSSALSIVKFSNTEPVSSNATRSAQSASHTQLVGQ
jgi:hypothetical protein